MSGVTYRTCRDRKVAQAAAGVLEAILMHTQYPEIHGQLMLVGAGSACGVDATFVPRPPGRQPGNASLRWALSKDGDADSVVLVLPRYIDLALRPRWSGKAVTLLAGEALPGDAIDLFTALSAELARG